MLLPEWEGVSWWELACQLAESTCVFQPPIYLMTTPVTAAVGATCLVRNTVPPCALRSAPLWPNDYFKKPGASEGKLREGEDGEKKMERTDLLSDDLVPWPHLFRGVCITYLFPYSGTSGHLEGRAPPPRVLVG